MRFHLLRSRRLPRPQSSRASDAGDTSGSVEPTADALEPPALVLLRPSTPPSSYAGGVTSTEAERDRALAERDAALEEAIVLREQILGARAYHAALMDAARAEAQLERDALVGELAIQQEELTYRALHWGPPANGADDVHA